MATNASTPYRCSQKDALFVERFVYDVIVYTLKKCGFPEKKLPPTDLKENVYNLAKFVKIAGASTLRVSLIMREEWRQMFVSRHNNSKFGDKEIPDILMTTVLCCRVIRRRVKQSIVELLLASFNEMALFLHHENIDFNFNKLVSCTSSCIIFTIGEFKSGPNTVEEFFDKFENISGYDRWITDFIKKYAVPYGSRVDVPDLFLERVKRQFKLKMRSINRSCVPSVEEVLDLIGYLPFKTLSAIVQEESIIFKEALQISNWPTFDQESPESPNDFESAAVEEWKSLESRLIPSKSPSEHTVKAESSKHSYDLGIEEDLEQMNLAADGVSQEVHGAIPKKKWFKKGSKNQ